MMQKRYDHVIPDTSCLILLEKINHLTLLNKMFTSIRIPTEIAKEFGLQTPSWITIHNTKNTDYFSNFDLDPGESAAILLSLESENALLILDDLKARNIASELDLDFTGSLGLFLKAKQLGIISSVRSMLDLIQNTNFRYSEKLYKKILDLANETQK